MNIFEHFSCYTKLPVRLDFIKQHILETGHVSKIIRVPVKPKSFLVYGGFHKYRDTAPYCSGGVIALIGFPKDAPEDLQRVVQVKEMLHVLDPDEATSPTKDKVNDLIDDLMVEETKRAMGIGLPAQYDHKGLLHALAILLPRDALDIIRPVYKRGGCTVEEIAKWAVVPERMVRIALTDSWRDLLESI